MAEQQSATHITLVKKGGMDKKLEFKMRKTIVAAAALMVAMTAPAFAQPHAPFVGAGRPDIAPFASSWYNPAYGEQWTFFHHPMVGPGTPFGVYEQRPDGDLATFPLLLGIGY
jgi:hypothetical protein